MGNLEFTRAMHAVLSLDREELATLETFIHMLKAPVQGTTEGVKENDNA